MTGDGGGAPLTPPSPMGTLLVAGRRGASFAEKPSMEPHGPVVVMPRQSRPEGRRGSRRASRLSVSTRSVGGSISQRPSQIPPGEGGDGGGGGGERASASSGGRTLEEMKAAKHSQDAAEAAAESASFLMLSAEDQERVRTEREAKEAHEREKERMLKRQMKKYSSKPHSAGGRGRGGGGRRGRGGRGGRGGGKSARNNTSE